MKTKNVIGKKVVRVQQTRKYDPSMGCMVQIVDYIELENGMRLIPIEHEWEDGYTTDVIVVKKG